VGSWEFREKGSRGRLRRVGHDEAAQPVFQSKPVEVQQQADAVATEAEIGDDLCFVTSDFVLTDLI
jgi:hypothetical protein